MDETQDKVQRLPFLLKLIRALRIMVSCTSCFTTTMICGYSRLSGGRQRLCSLAGSLETKSFSAEYWKWQHRFLLDAVAQYGPPSIFVTISPYEWTFPIPPWLASLWQITGRGPTELAGSETYHVTHVLEQVIHGYLCGSNDNRWTNQVFNYNRVHGCCNVQVYFYFLEFQGQGNVHVHLLVWLKDMKHIHLQLLHGDIPWSDNSLAHSVYQLQKSDKLFLSLQDTPTHVTN